MGKSFQDSEQRLSQISADLLKRMAEIQKLRELIEATEASKLSRGQSTTDRSVTAPPAAIELRV